MKIIDFHTHNFPDELAQRALSVMNEKLNGSFTAVGDGTIDCELRDMDKSGIAMAVNLPVATKPGYFDALFRRAIAIREGKNGETAAKRIIQLASVHPKDPQFAEHLKMLKENGINGIKLHPNYQGICLADESLFPFFEAVRDEGMFVISHCGFDPGYVGAPSVAGPFEVEALLSAVPGLRFIAAHVGGECGNSTGTVDRLLKFPNCMIDTAVLYNREDSDEARRIVREWPAGRIVFGTDYFWREQHHLVEWVKHLRPSEHDQELIFHLNADCLLHSNGENGIMRK